MKSLGAISRSLGTFVPRAASLNSSSDMAFSLQRVLPLQKLQSEQTSDVRQELTLNW